MVECKRCGRKISETERYEYLGETLCEYCYIDIRYPAKACDPWAVYSATRSREIMGQTGAEGLTEMQKGIYEFIRSSGKVTREGLMKNFNLTDSELQRQLAILRYCELIRGSNENGQIYLVPFN